MFWHSMTLTETMVAIISPILLLANVWIQTSIKQQITLLQITLYRDFVTRSEFNDAIFKRKPVEVKE